LVQSRRTDDQSENYEDVKDKVDMRTQTISFPDRQTLCVFPNERSNLVQAIAELGLKGRYPVIVLIGGEIDEGQADATRRAIQAVARTAEDMNAVIVCGGTDMGIMAEVGQMRSRNGYKFPLVGVTPEALVTWPNGPRSAKFLGWGEKRWQLESHFSHFILVPGDHFADQFPWIIDTATQLSKEQRSVTILMNGGEVSRKAIELSLENGRPLIALSRTGRLADELARQPERDKLITVIPVHAEQRIVEAIQAALSVTEISYGPRFDIREKVTSGKYVVEQEMNSIKEPISITSR
jgi:SLOG in TRPM, prokaryote